MLRLTHLSPNLFRSSKAIAGWLGLFLGIASLAFAAATVPGAQPAASQAVSGQDAPKKYYDRAKEGWFWYHDPAPETEKEEEKPETHTARRVPKMEDYTIDDLWNMAPDDFKALSEEFLKKAVQSPTEANVVDYITMQDIARRKAATYASVVGYVTQKYSSFDMNSVFPTNTPGSIAMTRTQNKEIESTILQAKDNFAILFFTQQGCEFCDKQRNILRFFNDKYHWAIKELDINDRAEVAARFNIATTPSMLLISRGKDDYIPVAVGVESLDAIEAKLFRGVRLLNGDIKPEEYNTYDYQKGSLFDYNPPPTLQENINRSRKTEVREGDAN